MLILRRVGACPFVQIFDLGIKGYGLPLHPRILGCSTHFGLSKIIENAWVQAPTLQDNSLYQLIIQIQPKFLFEQLKVYAQKPLQSGLIAGCFAKLVFDRAPYRKYP